MMNCPQPVSRRLMGGFGAIVRVAGRVVGDRRHDVAMSDTVAAQFVGDETTRCLSLGPQQSPNESARRSPVSTRLDESDASGSGIDEVSSRHCAAWRVNLTEPYKDNVPRCAIRPSRSSTACCSHEMDGSSLS